MGCGASTDKHGEPMGPIGNDTTTHKEGSVVEHASTAAQKGQPKPEANTARASAPPAAAEDGARNENATTAHASTAVDSGTHDADAGAMMGQALALSSAAVSAGGALASKASRAALADAQEAATFTGQDGSTGASGARLLLDGLRALDGAPNDVKTVLGAGWVLVSESAKFWAVGKVVVAVLEQIYELWNAWERKEHWVGLFVAYCKLVETDLLAAQKVFHSTGQLAQLEKQLQAARQVLETVVHRGRYASFLFAQYDEQALAEAQVAIEARKKECLFGHAADIKASSAQNLDAVQRLAAMVRQRQQRLEREAAFPGGLEERGRRMASLARAFGANEMDTPGRVEALLGRFVHAQRNHWLRAAQRRGEAGAEDIERYVAHHFVPHGLVHSPELDVQQAGSAESKSPSDAATASAAAQEKAMFHSLDPSAQAAQLQDLRSALTTAQVESEQMLQRADFHKALARVKQARSLLASLHALTSAKPAADGAPTLDALAEAGEALTALVSRVRAAQVAAGLLLPSSTPSLESLLSLSESCVSPSERSAYVASFGRAFSREIEQVRAWLALDKEAQQWKDMRVLPRERILAIRAPPLKQAQQAAAAADPSVAATGVPGSDESTLTASIFLAMLSELCPRSLRALHFVPDPAARAIAQAARDARKADRESTRSAARFLETLAARSQWRERNAARARARDEGDYADEDEPEPAELDDAERARLQAASAVKETPEETEQAEAALAEAAAASGGTGGGGDVVAAADLRRAVPSLVFQLAQCMPVYYANLLSQSAQLTRTNFAQSNVSDMLSELIVAPMLLPGKQQPNPNGVKTDEAAKEGDGDAGKINAARVCLALDGAQWAVPSTAALASAAAEGVDVSSSDGWEHSLLKALVKQVGPRFPPWLGVVLTLPPKGPRSKTFDKRVLQDPASGTRELLLNKHALDDDLSDDIGELLLPLPPPSLSGEGKQEQPANDSATQAAAAASA